MIDFGRDIIGKMAPFLKKRSNQVFLFGGLVVSFFALYAISFAADERRHLVPSLSGTPAIPKKEEVEKIGKKFEEISWYGSSIEEPGSCCVTPSHILFGKSVPSFNRVLMALSSLDVIIDGNYEDYLEFVHGQSQEIRVSWASFQNLQARGRGVLSSFSGLNTGEMRSLVELAIILSEIGNTETARNKGWVYGIVADRSADFIEKAMRLHPEIFPSFSKLNRRQQALLQDLLTFVRFDEITELKGVKEAFERIKKERRDKEHIEFLDLALFLYSCRLGGAHGDECCYSSPLFTRFAVKNITYLLKALLLLNEKSAEEAFRYYLAARADWLGLDSGSALSRVLTKIGAMMHLYTPAEGKVVKEAFLRLEPEAITTIVHEFDDFDSKEAICNSEHLATFLQNLRANGELGNSEREQISNSISFGLPFIVEALAISKETPNDLPLDFTTVSHFAAKDLKKLREGKLFIRPDGVVALH